jgi:hypothetical protein
MELEEPMPEGIKGISIRKEKLRLYKRDKPVQCPKLIKSPKTKLTSEWVLAKSPSLKKNRLKNKKLRRNPFPLKFQSK